VKDQRVAFDLVREMEDKGDCQAAVTTVMITTGKYPITRAYLETHEAEVPSIWTSVDPSSSTMNMYMYL
jgi:hypothetical protein